MSRVGKYPIALPDGVAVSQQGDTLTVKGKLGTLSMPVSDAVTVAIEDGKVVVAPKAEHASGRIMWGTVRSILASMVQGVSKGYQQNLEINGTGYRAAVQGVNLVLNLGFSHDVVFPVPEGLKITTPRPTLIVIDGMDKRLVGETAANICRFRKIDPYKGKGIKREGQQIRRKEGKKK